MQMYTNECTVKWMTVCLVINSISFKQRSSTGTAESCLLVRRKPTTGKVTLCFFINTGEILLPPKQKKASRLMDTYFPVGWWQQGRLTRPWRCIVLKPQQALPCLATDSLQIRLLGISSHLHSAVTETPASGHLLRHCPHSKKEDTRHAICVHHWHHRG